MRSSMNREQLTLGAALAAPLIVTSLLVPFRDRVANTNAALVLVLVVVAVAAWSGRRLPSIVTAVSAGLWFDVFLTRPYQRLTIDDPTDVETAVLLLLVGVAVSELSVWGRRQHASASRQAGYLAGIREAVQVTAVQVTTAASSPGTVVETACTQLSGLLHLRGCRFDPERRAVGGDNPRLRPDGEVEIDQAVCDIEHFGLPTEHDIDLLLFGEGGYQGRFVLTAAPGAQPSLPQRLAAVALADQVAGVLSQDRLDTTA